MSVLTIAIITFFVIGYLCIALESPLRVNKAAFALLMCVGVWTLFMLDPLGYVEKLHGSEFIAEAGNIQNAVSEILIKHLGDASETLFFLMGAMTIVEIVDVNGGFNFVRVSLSTQSKRRLMWRIALMTFFLSAILDNLTTSIVMVMVLRKLVPEHKDRMIYGAAIVISANSGGAFSPIGDVTTIMLWIANRVTSVGVITEIFIPSLVSMLIPVGILQYQLKGKLAVAQACDEVNTSDFSNRQKKAIFWFGVGGLVFVPVFRSLTDLPPFMGILLVLGVLWLLTEMFYRSNNEVRENLHGRVSKILTKIDFATILFFLGILMAVGCLQEISVLHALGKELDVLSNSNHYVVTGIIGVVSSIVDNVPLVAASMHMYAVQATGDMAVDGIFWQLLAYCAGTGGSLLIIGSAAGVVVMGLEKITFGWYMKHITWVAAVGYFAGMISYYVIRTFLWV